MISRRSLCVALGASMLLAAPAGAQPPAASPPAAGPGSISGIWRLENYVGTRRPTKDRIVKDETGSLPPLLPATRAIYEKRIRDNDDNRPFASTTSHCLPGGMPQMMMSASYPIQILETPGQVTLLFEEQGARRMIYMDEKHPEEPEPGFTGHSVGRWEGDTLVVDTVGLNDRITIDILGMPQSDSMHIVERIRRVSPNQLENVITIEDPKTFSRPWRTRMTYRHAPTDRIQEYVCENNRNEPDGDTVTFKTPKN